MDEAFDCLLDLIDNNINDTNYDDHHINEQIILNQCINEVKAITSDDVMIPPIAVIEIEHFNPYYNILNYGVIERLRSEVVFHETNIITAPYNTTNTLEGYLSNVSFHEENLIKQVYPDEKIVIYKCNYGKLKYPGYIEPTKVKKTNRGRKPKEKVKKVRKKQGDGTDFNSQVTFIALPSSIPLIFNIAGDYYDIPQDSKSPTKVLKFKVFRSGKIQLTGAQQELFDDIVTHSHGIADILNDTLHQFEEDISRRTYVINVNVVMKNYKFLVKLLPKHIVNLGALNQIFAQEMKNNIMNITTSNSHTGASIHPKIAMITYNRSNNKLSVVFATPVVGNPEKITLVNMFMRGKVNILGALDYVMTDQICRYINWVLETNQSKVIMREGDTIVHKELLAQNIAHDDISDHLDELDHPWMPPLPEISPIEYEDIMTIAHEIYCDRMEAAESLLNELLDDLYEY